MWLLRIPFYYGQGIVTDVGKLPTASELLLGTPDKLYKPRHNIFFCIPFVIIHKGLFHILAAKRLARLLAINLSGGCRSAHRLGGLHKRGPVVLNAVGMPRLTKNINHARGTLRRCPEEDNTSSSTVIVSLLRISRDNRQEHIQSRLYCAGGGLIASARPFDSLQGSR